MQTRSVPKPLASALDASVAGSYCDLQVMTQCFGWCFRPPPSFSEINVTYPIYVVDLRSFFLTLSLSAQHLRLFERLSYNISEWFGSDVQRKSGIWLSG